MDGLVFVRRKSRFNLHNRVLNIIGTDFKEQKIKQDNKLTKTEKINNLFYQLVELS